MNYFNTIVLSDIHLGNPNAKTEELEFFLKNNKADNYILNGDIIDMWSIRRGTRWTKEHTKIMRKFLKISYKKNVIYIRGNHDDFLDDVTPMSIGNIKILKEKKFKCNQDTYLVIHGDVFDLITTKAPWLSFIGGYMYDALLWINRKYNKWREKRGLEYMSLSKIAKDKVKTAVNYISDFETQIAQLAKQKNTTGVICGHIHNPCIRNIDGITYMNSGDWVENCTALAQDEEGWKIIQIKKMKNGFSQQTIIEPIQNINP